MPDAPKNNPPAPAGVPSAAELEALRVAEARRARAAGLEESIGNVANETVNALEWQILDGPKEKHENHERPAILGLFPKAQTAIEKGNLEEAENCFLTAKAELARAQSTWGAFAYRLVCHWGILGIVLTVLSSAAVYIVIFKGFMHLDDSELVKEAVFAGWLGAALKSLYHLQRHIGSGELRPRWHVYFLAAPWIGTLLGWIIWLLVAAATSFLADGANVTPNWKTISFLAVFAGFKWEWALEWMEETAANVRARFGQKSDAKQQDGSSPTPPPTPPTPEGSSSASASASSESSSSSADEGSSSSSSSGSAEMDPPARDEESEPSPSSSSASSESSSSSADKG